MVTALRPLTADQARRLRARAQWLGTPVPPAEDGVASVVRGVCGVQAQDRRAAALAVRARSTGLTARDVERAQVTDRSVVRTWGMRGTFHLLAADDVGWLLPLLGPVFVAAGRRRFAELGLDEAQCGRGVGAIRRSLERHGSRTRAELADDLRGAGLPVEPGSQAVVHLVRRAALQGLVCVGPDRDGDEAYVALDDWVGTDGRPRRAAADASLAELARRYVAAYGPAGPHDLAAWSGLPVARARQAWRLLADAGELAEVSVDGSPSWALAGRTLDAGAGRGTLGVRLLPAFDTYLLGYRTHESQVDPRHAARVWPGGGWIHPTLSVDGRVLAAWRISSTRVVVEPFDVLQPAVLRSLEGEAADVGRFLGLPVSLTVEPAGR
jgi:hypothetical protein